MSPKEQEELVARLGRLGRRFNEIADMEAQAALVQGWAAQGHMFPEKERILRQMEEALDQGIGKQKSTIT
jgi:hypothetical protein